MSARMQRWSGSAAAVGARAQALPDRYPALPAIVLYLGVQAIGVAILAVLSAQHDRSLTELLGSWDSDWFERVATLQYTEPVRVNAQGSPAQTALAFFPLYPTLMAPLIFVGVPGVFAALLVTVASGIAAAWGLYALGAELASARAGTLLAGLVAMAPGSGVLHMGYSEATFIALTAWALLTLVRERWFLAGVLGCFAGLTRMAAIALFAAIAVGAIVAAVRRRGGWRPAMAVCVAPLGLVAYLGFVAWRTGRIDGWFWLQDRAWGLHFDAFALTWRHLTEVLSGKASTWVTLVGVVVLGTLMLLLWSYVERLPPSVHVYTTLALVIALGASTFWQSRPRFLLAAFTVALPLAVLLARAPRRVLAVLLPAGALAGGWLAAFLLAVVGLNP